MTPPPARKFSGIFISYRREDSAGHTGRLYDRLSAHFGDDQVFMDIDQIEPGEDFIQIIEDAVGSCEILIAVIGRRWLTAGDETSRRLDNPNDFVRLEIAAALRRNIIVIPVLVQGAVMPSQSEVPDDLSDLSRRQASELSDRRWNHDANQLIAAIERALTRHREARKEEERQAELSRRKAEEVKKLRLEAEEAKEGRRRTAEEAERRSRRENQEAVRRRGGAQERGRLADGTPKAGFLARLSPYTPPVVERALDLRTHDRTTFRRLIVQSAGVLFIAASLISLLAIMAWNNRRAGDVQSGNGNRPPQAQPTAAQPAPAIANPLPPKIAEGESADSQPMPTPTARIASLGELHVRVRANGEDVWLRSKVDGQPPTEGILAADETREFSATDTLSLQYAKSKAPALEVTINGRPATVPAETPQGKALVEFLIRKDNYEQLLQQP